MILKLKRKAAQQNLASCIRCENELETGREEMNYRGDGLNISR